MQVTGSMVSEHVAYQFVSATVLESGADTAHGYVMHPNPKENRHHHPIHNACLESRLTKALKRQW